MDQLIFWQKKTVESLSIQDCSVWLKGSLKALPSAINTENFIELIKENINFPEEAEDYLNNLFHRPLNTSQEVSEIIKSAGKDFYLTAFKSIESGYKDWNDAVKAIGVASNKKGKDLFMPLRVAITGQTKGPELDKVVNIIGVEQVLIRFKEASEL